MTNGERIIDGLKEVQAIFEGRLEPARVHCGLPGEYEAPDALGVRWYEDDQWVGFMARGICINRRKATGATRASLQESVDRVLNAKLAS